MPWIRSLFFVFALLMLQTVSAEWGEGWDPIEPPVPTAAPEGKIEVVEFFWYGCPHCYTLDPLMEEWVAKKPDNVVFRHVPAPLNPSWTVHSQFFYAAEALGVSDKLHVPLFEALHDKRRKLFDKQSLIDFAVEHGVDRKNFTEAWNSFGVFVKVQQARKLSQRFQLDGVPAVGINGKYKTSATLAGSYPKMFQVVDELVKQESQSK
ncbi:MAG: disulfide bond formation protein DsbA [endosymbiont of Seepiophila jonesi]|uniref:Thiol:disulfide interchange protein n=1 Tax=endosymbiont of Lamellibrachia luymesi TaxID=2200907 RepID=A0A370DX43_9GAMM|nr:MAG: disulfide bond formation protein DsbA [endosymbiont of Lamellibrachia luymesi]RDH93788.1 MAG: disulfide bond formation protein DsbA [endosymbiont of Seepiophila jonesi]